MLIPTIVVSPQSVFTVRVNEVETVLVALVPFTGSGMLAVTVIVNTPTCTGKVGLNEKV
jgi:hypothetical protein